MMITDINDKHHIIKLSCETDAGLGERAKIGLIVLQSDQTIEHEFRDLLNLDGVEIYHSRIPNDMNVTKESLAKMEADLPIAASLLPGAFDFNAIGYGCTSGATVIGEDLVAGLIKNTHPNAQISNPLTACKAALRALGLKRVAFLTPYSPDVTSAMQDNLLEDGFEMPITGSFYQSDDFTVGRITQETILRSIEEIGANENCDGVFVSCTSLRVAKIIETAEARLGKPVTSSNHALAWHLLRLAGVQDSLEGRGSLFKK